MNISILCTQDQNNQQEDPVCSNIRPFGLFSLNMYSSISDGLAVKCTVSGLILLSHRLTSESHNFPQ